MHESSYVDEGAKIGEGTKIWYFCHVQSGAEIGCNCSLGQNVNVASNVKIGDGVKIQNNVSVYEGVELADYVFCGPSCVFTNDLLLERNIRRGVLPIGALQLAKELPSAPMPLLYAVTR